MRARRFRFRSKSERGLKWTVHVMNGRGVCNCRGFTEWGHCWHLTKGLQMSNDTAEKTAVAVRTPNLAPAPATTLPDKDEYQMMMLIAQQAGSGKGLVPASVKTPEQAFGVILAGWELGVPPITALRHISVIHGRTEPDAQLKMALVKEAEPDAEFKFTGRTIERVTVELWRHGNLVCEVTYTWDDAVKGGCLNQGRSTAWKDHPLDMLTWAAIHRVTRLGAGDIINAVNSSARMGLTMKGPTPAPHDIDNEMVELTGELPEVAAAELSPEPETETEPACEHDFREVTSGAVVCRLCDTHLHDLEAAEPSTAKGRST